MEGLEKFREAFADFSDNYVVIGGTACDIAMTGTTVRPRATHDIDMIVIAENITEAFGEQFWKFIREAGYRPEKRKHKEGEPPKYELYRFLDGRAGYPEMIELLSRHPDVLGEPKGVVIEPLPIGDDVSSLSAIIMDDDFYHLYEYMIQDLCSFAVYILEQRYIHTHWQRHAEETYGNNEIHIAAGRRFGDGFVCRG